MHSHTTAKFRRVLLSTCIALSISTSLPVLAQNNGADQLISITLAAANLADSLNALAKNAALNVSVDPQLIAGLKAPAIAGDISIEEAFERLLENTRLKAVDLGNKNYVIKKAVSTDFSAAGKLPALIITGEKFDRSLQNTTTAISVIQGDNIHSSEQSSVYQAMERMPNVANNASTLPTIRGISGGAIKGNLAFRTGARPKVNTTVDNVSQSWAGQRYLDVGLWDVKQVEVLRGSQSTTQGRNSIGGAIVIKSNDPSFTAESALRLGYQNDSEKYHLAAMISGPIIDDELAFRVNAESLTGHGFIHYSLPEANTPDWDPSDIKRQNLKAKLLWEPEAIPELSAKLTFAHRVQKGEYLNFIEHVAGNSHCSDLSQLAFCGITSNTRRTDSSNNSISSDIEYQLSDSLNTHFTLSRNTNVAKFTQSDGGLDLDQKDTSNSFESRLIYKPDNSLVSGVLGLYYFDRYQKLNATENDGNPDLFSGDDSVTTLAAYVDSTITVNDKLDLLAGVRVERENQKRDILGWPGKAWEVNIKADISETMVLPKLGLSYKLTPQTNLALTVRQGYTPGGGSSNWNDNYYYEYDKEEVTTYELSSRSQLLDNRLSINNNLFYSTYKDYQAVYASNLTNVAKATTYGLETEIMFKPDPSLDLYAAVGLLHSEITATDSSMTDLLGKELSTAPSLTASLGFNKQLQNNIHFGADVSHTGGYFSDLVNDSDNQAGNYTVLNANIGYDQKDYQVRAYIRNITDEAIIYANDYSSSHWRTGMATTASVTGQPRTFGITLDYQF